MKKQYIISLAIIMLLLVCIITIGTGYGIWTSSNSSYQVNSNVVNCFKIYYSENDIIEMKNIKPLVNSEGEDETPYTLTITNICSDKKELQLRLNILNDSTISTDSLTLKASGDIELATTLFKNLDSIKNKNDNVSQSKLIGKLEVEPNETIRTNVKMWFDEKKSPNIPSDKIFKAKFEVVDTESSTIPSLVEIVLSNEINSSIPDYNTVSLSNEGIYSVTNGDDTYYYYRGVVNNNYVNFANYTWRIVGINPDKSVKLILNNSISSSKYSDNKDAIDYTGYKYIYNNEEVNNVIFNTLNNWYKENIKERNFDSYVSNYNFCNDTSVIEDTANNDIYFSSYDRLIKNKKPTIICPDTDNDFGGKYNMKIGLITADEVSMAGGLYKYNNFNYYLYNSENYYTSTPGEYTYENANVFIVTNTGSLDIASVDSENAIRPVINLASTVTATGSGTVDNPYVIEID